MAKKRTDKANSLPVSKQTAGGVTGAVLGGIVGGPVGAVAGGIAGALLGNSSAKGQKPIKKAVDAIRSKVTGETYKAAIETSAPVKKKSASKTKKKSTSKKSLAKAKSKQTTTKKAKTSSIRNAKGTKRPGKKKA